MDFWCFQFSDDFSYISCGPSHQQNNAGGSDGDNGVVFGSKNEGTMNTGGAPLGDELSTAVSLPLLRTLVHSWLRDAYGSNSQVADDLLHDDGRLDPARCTLCPHIA